MHFMIVASMSNYAGVEAEIRLVLSVGSMAHRYDSIRGEEEKIRIMLGDRMYKKKSGSKLVEYLRKIIYFQSILILFFALYIFFFLSFFLHKEAL